MSVLAAGQAETEVDDGVVAMIRGMTRDDGRPVFTPATAASALVFFVLAMQCLPTLTVTRKETGGLQVRRPAARLYVGPGLRRGLPALPGPAVGRCGIKELTMPLCQLQDVIVALVALGAAVVVARRVIGFAAPRRSPKCANCESGACAPSPSPRASAAASPAGLNSSHSRFST